MNCIKYSSILLTLALFTLACGKKAEPTSESTEAAATPEMNSNSVTLSAEQAAQAAIQTGTFTLRSLSDYLDVNAELVLGKENTAQVSAFTEGIISELRIRNNSSVAKGGVVAVLRKPDLLDLQQQYLENKDRMVFLETEYQRYKALKENDATATKNFQKAEADWRAAQTSAKLLAAKLRQYQIDPAKLTPDNLRTELLITSPVAGVVTRVDASLGQALNLGEPICEVSNLAYLHPVLYVFEKNLNQVKAGQKVQLKFPGGNEQVFNAHIDYLERSVDGERKTVRVHARFDNTSAASNQQMAKGGFLNARITLADAGMLPALPEEAVIQEQGGYFIFYQEKKDAKEVVFHKVPVKRGPAGDGYVAIEPLETLPRDAAIVLKGAYYVSANGGVSAEE
ncbi:efflux RND transporter periplasmic adaptor subunit [Haliscomenobacter hydrossis]|uniref:Efflux transporter, RND family, MFP subunit n=1 Tax=Haliscomenobacter hydrossis (strain ATCC 27775 / DSM 1100 / LMG 10767 / O) TaxID=760192 RepID=F4KWG2_HALH1|nr:efflux RND transporter periplasmic adaptor subunit [Haliscomenobacter hydrossis]AEE50312.1 efflux transporter, RND family, MFP subunit [Haliscomenobacter hydrossis DSM 1100]